MNENKQNEAGLKEAFLQLVRDQIDRGVYVWGGNGEILSRMEDPAAFIRRHETSAENAARGLRLYKKRIGQGIADVRAFDCSGLVFYALNALGVQKTDLSSRGLYALCRPVTERELLPGDLVFHHDGQRIVHVGIADGDEQIECRGRDVGVVRNRRKPGYWNRFGRLPAFEPAQSEFVRIKGGSVRVREGDSTRTRCLGIVHRGETYPLLGHGESGWYRILWRGEQAYITNKTRYTEVCHG